MAEKASGFSGKVLQSRAAGCILAGVAVLALLLAGCGTERPDTADTGATDAGAISVYASFYPMYDFAVKIGGDRVEVVNMVPSGVEPHDWEPAAADITGLEGADVFIYNGAGMEHWAEDILETLQNKELVVVEASRGIELIEGHDEHGDEDEDEDEDEHEDEGFDPHVWLDPERAKAEMGTIRDALKQASPADADYFDSNYEKYAAQLDALDAEFKAALGPLENRDIIVAHQAFGYLCAAYGLNQIPIEGLSAESEPDPARVAEIIEFADEHEIKVIFFEELVSPKVAQTIADAIGAEVDVLNPFEGPGDGGDYFGVMRLNLEALLRALQ